MGSICILTICIKYDTFIVEIERDLRGRLLRKLLSL
jgi:hypothetical protein